jgi:6-phospho-3-hexuloisomerase
MALNLEAHCQPAEDRQMNPHSLVEAILIEHQDILKEVPDDEIDLFIEELGKAGRVFCAAQGRSGYVLRCFCQRLMQLGYRAFFVGETITPNIEAGDLLVVLSGSGQTTLTKEWVRIARDHEATAFGIMGVADSPIGRELDGRLVLPAGSKLEHSRASETVQPPGSLFEQAAFVLLETIVLVICSRRRIDPTTILERHANLE